MSKLLIIFAFVTVTIHPHTTAVVLSVYTYICLRKQMAAIEGHQAHIAPFSVQRSDTSFPLLRPSDDVTAH